MLIGFLVNYLTLFGLLYFFEPEKREIDWLRLAAIAALPGLIVVIVGVATSLLISPYLWSAAMVIVAVAVVTFFMLRKLLSIPTKRAAAYAVAMVQVNATARYLLQ